MFITITHASATIPRGLAYLCHLPEMWTAPGNDYSSRRLNQVWQKERLVRSKTIYFWDTPRKYLLSEWPSARIWAATQPHGEIKYWQRQECSTAPVLEYPDAMKIVNTRNTCITPRVTFHTTSGLEWRLKEGRASQREVSIRTETTQHGGLTETLENLSLCFLVLCWLIWNSRGAGPQSCVNQLTLINYLKIWTLKDML